MFITSIIGLLIFINLGYAIEPSESCGEINFPRTFYLRGQWEAYWHEKVYITPEADTDDDAGEEYGIFESMCMSFNGDVELVNSGGNLVGYTDKQTAFEWGSEINIYDCTNKKIWIVDEDGGQVIVNGLNPFGSLFGIYEVDNSGEKSTQIGFADEDDFLDSSFTIRNMQGQIIARDDKSFWDQAVSSVSDTTWEIQTFGNTTNHQALIVSYIVSLREVQDQLEDTDYDYDMCTQWAIGAIVIAILAFIIVVGCIVWICCCGDTKNCDLSGLI